MSNFFDDYFGLRTDLDKQIQTLEKEHNNSMQCKLGCDSCCESIRIFPLEFDAIRYEISNKQLPPYKFKHAFSKSCRFLKNGQCQIYESRPIICRTQGLPLLYENREGAGYELSVCKLNFVGVNVSTFTTSNALFMPPVNSRLFLANQKYIETLNKNLKVTTRIKLNKL